MIQPFTELQKNQSQPSMLPVRFNEPSVKTGTGFDEILSRKLAQPGEPTHRPPEIISPNREETPQASVQLDRPEDFQRDISEFRQEQRDITEKSENTDRHKETAAVDKKADSDQHNEKAEKNDEGSLSSGLKSLSSELRSWASEASEKKSAKEDNAGLIDEIESSMAALMAEEKISPEALRGLIEKTEKLLEGIDDKQARGRGRELLAKLKELLKNNGSKEEIALPKLKESLKEFSAFLEDTVKPALKKTAQKSLRTSAHGETAMVQDKPEDGAALIQNNTFNSEQGNDRGRDNLNGQNFQTNIKNASIKGNAAETASAARRSFQQHFNEITQRAQVVVKDSRNGVFNLRLYPRQLGSVTVNLGLEQGVLNGRFLVESAEAKNLLMENLEAVREHLEEAGIDVGAFEVNVRDQHQAQSDREDLPQSAFKQNTDLKEEQQQYDISAAPVHNGAINVVI